MTFVIVGESNHVVTVSLEFFESRPFSDTIAREGGVDGVKGMIAMVIRRTRVPGLLSRSSRFCRAYDSALIVGIYEEIARQRVFCVDPGEWSPAAWKGTLAITPTPIHQTRGSLLSSMAPNCNLSNTGSTATSHSQ